MKKSILLIIIIFLLTGCKDKTYTVSFYNDDGSLLSSVIVNEGDNIKSYGTPTKDGYIFVSWLKDGVKYDEDSEVNDNIDLVASYTLIPEVPESYIIYFDFGNNDIRELSVNENECVNKPEDPYKEKYIFLGWYLDDELYDFSKPVTSSFTLVAKYEKKFITITIDLNDGSDYIYTEIDKDSYLNIDNPSRYGYNFSYWELNGNRFDTNSKISSDITLKAIWDPKVYVRIKFDTDGGSIVLAKIIESGSKLDNVDTPIKDGYIFKYWTLDGNYFDLNNTINSNITLKAYYEESN